MEHYPITRMKDMTTSPNDAVRATIGENVTALRRARGLSMGELARSAGIGKATLSEIESGKRNATIDTLYALTVALGVPLGAPLQDVRDPVLAGQGIRADLATRLVDPHGTSELYRVVIRAGSPPHPAAGEPGLHKTAIVFRGTLLITGPGTERRVQSGQTAEWSADAPESYSALGHEDVAASLLLRYSREVMPGFS
jgi:XRE family transcriptional regulator, regulator of sulfur utilization